MQRTDFRSYRPPAIPDSDPVSDSEEEQEEEQKIEKRLTEEERARLLQELMQMANAAGESLDSLEQKRMAAVQKAREHEQALDLIQAALQAPLAQTQQISSSRLDLELLLNLLGQEEREIRRIENRNVAVISGDIKGLQVLPEIASIELPPCTLTDLQFRDLCEKVPSDLSALTLDSVYLTGETVGELRRFKDLRFLKLSNFQEICPSLRATLPTLVNLEYLALTDTSLETLIPPASAYTNLFSGFKRLCTLDLSSSQVTMDFLQNVSKISSLQRLTLEGCTIDGQPLTFAQIQSLQRSGLSISSTAVAASLTVEKPKGKLTLEVIMRLLGYEDFRADPDQLHQIPATAADLRKSLPLLDEIDVLELHGVDISNEQFAVICEKCSPAVLKTVSIQYCRMLSGEGLALLQKFIHITSLTLDALGNHQKGDAVANLLPKLPKLSDVTFHRSQIVNLLAQNLISLRQLNVLVLSYCSFATETLESWCQTFQGRSFLLSLDMCTDFQDELIPEALIRSLRTQYANPDRLQILYISVEIPPVTVEALLERIPNYPARLENRTTSQFVYYPPLLTMVPMRLSLVAPEELQGWEFPNARKLSLLNSDLADAHVRNLIIPHLREVDIRLHPHISREYLEALSNLLSLVTDVSSLNLPLIFKRSPHLQVLCIYAEVLKEEAAKEAIVKSRLKVLFILINGQTKEIALPMKDLVSFPVIFVDLDASTTEQEREAHRIVNNLDTTLRLYPIDDTIVQIPSQPQRASDSSEEEVKIDTDRFRAQEPLTVPELDVPEMLRYLGQEARSVRITDPATRETVVVTGFSLTRAQLHQLPRAQEELQIGDCAITPPEFFDQVRYHKAQRIRLFGHCPKLVFEIGEIQRRLPQVGELQVAHYRTTPLNFTLAVRHLRPRALTISGCARSMFPSRGALVESLLPVRREIVPLLPEVQELRIENNKEIDTPTVVTLVRQMHPHTLHIVNCPNVTYTEELFSACEGVAVFTTDSPQINLPLALAYMLSLQTLGISASVLQREEARKAIEDSNIGTLVVTGASEETQYPQGPRIVVVEDRRVRFSDAGPPGTVIRVHPDNIGSYLAVRPSPLAIEWRPTPPIVASGAPKPPITEGKRNQVYADARERQGSLSLLYCAAFAEQMGFQVVEVVQPQRLIMHENNPIAAQLSIDSVTSGEVGRLDLEKFLQRCNWEDVLKCYRDELETHSVQMEDTEEWWEKHSENPASLTPLQKVQKLEQLLQAQSPSKTSYYNKFASQMGFYVAEFREPQRLILHRNDPVLFDPSATQTREMEKDDLKHLLERCEWKDFYSLYRDELKKWGLEIPTEDDTNWWQTCCTNIFADLSTPSASEKKDLKVQRLEAILQSLVNLEQALSCVQRMYHGTREDRQWWSDDQRYWKDDRYIGPKDWIGRGYKVADGSSVYYVLRLTREQKEQNAKTLRENKKLPKNQQKPILREFKELINDSTYVLHFSPAYFVIDPLTEEQKRQNEEDMKLNETLSEAEKHPIFIELVPPPRPHDVNPSSQAVPDKDPAASRREGFFSLDLSSRSLTSLPGCFHQQWAHLLSLLLSDNRLRSLQQLELKILSLAKVLEHLDLSNNEIASIPPEFTFLLNDLVSLDLRHNRLHHQVIHHPNRPPILRSSLPKNFFLFQRLKEEIREYDQRRAADPSAPPSLPLKRHLYLQGNPLPERLPPEWEQWREPNLFLELLA